MRIFILVIAFLMSGSVFAEESNLEIKKEFKKLFFLGAMGCGVCGAFPFMAGMTTTVANMGIIYTSSPIFIILNLLFLSFLFRNDENGLLVSQ